MQVSAGGLSGVSQHYSSQPEGSQTKAPNYGGYSILSVYVQRSMLDSGCFECGDIGHFKRNSPRVRQGGQDTQFQASRAPASGRRRGSYGGNRAQSGCGGHTAGEGGPQPNRGRFQSGRGGNQSGRGGAQTGQVDRNGSQAIGERVHFYAFPCRIEAEGSDAVITGDVLMQENKVIAYASRQLKVAEMDGIAEGLRHYHLVSSWQGQCGGRCLEQEIS
ncbi:uncharacterized protein LOC132045640 [Lycium ferocissimum]|uniref:uncharacterized protein LOC132045640 n=1 Tax=Lycium ferocissimum TaxID=112874 RepID=UPI00281561C4|nr:uncharacterized protein LOC132045640 [Lycium ferocissimum]